MPMYKSVPNKNDGLVKYEINSHIWIVIDKRDGNVEISDEIDMYQTNEVYVNKEDAINIAKTILKHFGEDNADTMV